MTTTYQPPGWLTRFIANERPRGRVTDEPTGKCGHCASTILQAGRALCRKHELEFGYNLIDDWQRCSGCFNPFGNALDHGIWIERSPEGGNLCRYCYWCREGLSVDEMLKTIARECRVGGRFVIRLNLELTRPIHGRWQISRDDAIRRIASGSFYHRTLIEMLKHSRCSLEQASAVFLRIAHTVVEAVEAEEREIDVIASRDGWRTNEARPDRV